MHDKQIRRRRAVLLLLVVTSLLLLTAYFGESPSSPLHSVQRGFVAVLTPVQEGASKVLSPVRDIAGWFSDTFHAKTQRDQYKREYQALLIKYDRAQDALAQNAQLRAEVGLDHTGSISNYKPIAGNVISRNPTLWYADVEIDKGSGDGVRLNDPVLGDGALVGKVTTVGSGFCIVSLITDHTFAVTAQVQDGQGDSGVLVPVAGNPDQMQLQYLPRQAGIQAGQQVVTAGFHSGSLDSLFPPGIPIGTVLSADQSTLLATGQVTVTPAADLRHLSVVQILTQPSNGAALASASTGARAQVGSGASGP